MKGDPTVNDSDQAEQIISSGTSRGAVVPLMPKGELDQLAIEAGTDKSSKSHDYMRFYEYLLGPYRDQRFTLLELGVGIPSRKAPSLRTWKAFFPEAQIVGVDIRRISKSFEEERIAVEIGDASRPRFLRRLARRWTPSVVIDDASHYWSHQIIGFRTLFPLLPPGGIYVVEDVHTSFHQAGATKYADHPESFLDLFGRLQKALVASQHGGPQLALSPAERRLTAWIDSVIAIRHCVAIVKRQTVRRRELPPRAAPAAEADKSTG